jgi:hypothetical protein
MANEVVTGVESIVLSFAEMTVAQKKEDLTTRLNAEIASTSSFWVKTRDGIYVNLLSYANDFILNKINSWIS